MSIVTMLEDARNSINELKRKSRFKKANAKRAEAAELQASLAKCRGKLEMSQKDFNRVIKTQSKNIEEGKRLGADTSIQEQILWDAALGYMLVKDAIFSLRTISGFDSVSHSYEMLSTAIDLMTKREKVIPKFPKLLKSKERNIYGFVTSNAALKEKEELLDGFFEKLKETGDIEACIAGARTPSQTLADRRAHINDGIESADASDMWDSVLGSGENGNVDPGVDIGSPDLSLLDIHPSTDSENKGESE